MTSPVLVTGGPGTLGQLVVARLRDAGCEVRVLSRRHHEGAGGIEFIAGDLVSCPHPAGLARPAAWSRATTALTAASSESCDHRAEAPIVHAEPLEPR